MLAPTGETLPPIGETLPPIGETLPPGEMRPPSLEGLGESLLPGGSCRGESLVLGGTWGISFEGLEALAGPPLGVGPGGRGLHLLAGALQKEAYLHTCCPDYPHVI